MTTIVFGVGLLFGALILLSVLRVYLTNKTFSLGDGSFATLGVLLLGMSVWTSATVKVSASGFEAEFETMKRQVQEVSQQVATVADSSGTLSEGLANVGQKVNDSEATVTKLTTELEHTRAVAPATAEQIRTGALRTPSINVERYRALSQQLHTLGASRPSSKLAPAEQPK